MKKRFSTAAGRLAFGGMMTALSLVLQLAGGAIGIGTFAAPMLAGLCTMAVQIVCGRKTAGIHWLAAGLLSLILCPDKELSVLYLLLFGWYPLILPTLHHLKKKPLRILAKAAVFTLSVTVIYALLVLLLFNGSWKAAGFGSVWAAPLWLLAGNVIFLMYDSILQMLYLRMKSIK